MSNPADDPLAWLLALAIVGLGVSLLGRRLSRQGARALLSPSFWFTFGLASYYGIGTSFLFLYPKNEWYLASEVTSFAPALALVLVGFALFAVTLNMARRSGTYRRAADSSPETPARSAPGTITTTVWVAPDWLILGGVTVLWVLRVRLGLAGLGLTFLPDYVEPETAGQRFELHAIGLLSALLLPLLILRMVRGQRTASSWPVMLFALLFGGELAFEALKGGRKSVAGILLLLLLGYILERGRAPRRVVLLSWGGVVLAGLLFMTVWRVVRTTEVQETLGDFVRLSVTKTVDLLVEGDPGEISEIKQTNVMHRLNGIELLSGLLLRQSQGYSPLPWWTLANYVQRYTPTLLWPDKHLYVEHSVMSYAKLAYNLPYLDQNWLLLCDFVMLGGWPGLLLGLIAAGFLMAWLDRRIPELARSQEFWRAGLLYIVFVLFLFEGSLDRLALQPLRNIAVWWVIFRFSGASRRIPSKGPVGPDPHSMAWPKPGRG